MDLTDHVILFHLLTTFDFILFCLCTKKEKGVTQKAGFHRKKNKKGKGLFGALHICHRIIQLNTQPIAA